MPRHRTQVRNRLIEERGKQQVLKEELDRRRVSPLSAESIAKKARPNQARDAGRKQRSGQPRTVKKKKPYPTFLMKKFERATILLGRKMPPGTKEISWGSLSKLLAAVLDSEFENLPQEYQDDGRTSGGLVKYRAGPFKTALSKHLEVIPEKPTYWRFKKETVRRHLHNQYEVGGVRKLEDKFVVIVNELIAEGRME